MLEKSYYCQVDYVDQPYHYNVEFKRITGEVYPSFNSIIYILTKTMFTQGGISEGNKVGQDHRGRVHQRGRGLGQQRDAEHQEPPDTLVEACA